MERRILVIDNDEKDRQSLGRWLMQMGYYPVLASSIDEARRQLDGGYFHALTIDMRMKDDTNPDDYSGFTIITDPAYAYIPKIISTSYKQSAFKDEWGPEITNRSDVFFMGKTDSWEQRRSTLQRVFESIKDDFEIRFHFSSQNIVSFLHLLALITKERSAKDLAEGTVVLEALFRRLFRGKNQVTIERLIFVDKEMIALQVFAYIDGSVVVPVPYIVLIGFRNAVAEETSRYPGNALQGINTSIQLSNQSDMESIGEYAGVAYAFSAQDPENVRSLSKFVVEEHLTHTHTALEHLVNGQLQKLHQRKYTIETGDAFLKFYKDWLHQISGDQTVQKLLQNIETLCRKAKATGIARLELGINTLTLTKVPDELLTVKLPEALLPGLPNLTRSSFHLTHGELTLDKILVTSNQQCCLIGFNKSMVAPHPHDFAQLELSFRRHTWHLLDMARILEVEKELALSATEEANVNNLKGQSTKFNKVLEAIRYLRHLAYTQASCDPAQYILCLRYLALIELLSFNPTLYYTRHDLQWYIHILLLATGLLDAEVIEPNISSIEVNPHENAVSVNGTWHHLSRTDFRFFYCLWQKSGEVCAFEDIETYIRQSFEADEDSSNNHDFSDLMSDFRKNIHTIVSRVRKDLGFEKDWPIENVRGIGYKFVIPEASKG